MSVCKKCLNPEFKNGLCVEHCEEKEYGSGPHVFTISGDYTVFNNVKAFDVYKVYDKDEYEITIKGHAIKDYHKIKTLIHTHFKGAYLFVTFFVPSEAIYNYELIWNEYCKYGKDGVGVEELFYAQVTPDGVWFKIQDTGYMNVEHWKYQIKCTIDDFTRWCRKKLLEEAYKRLNRPLIVD